MNDSPHAEWGVEAMACVYAAASSFTVVLLWSKAEGMQYPPPPANHVPFSWARCSAVAVLWLLMTLVFSFPSFMYALAQSIPGGQNTLHVSTTVLDGYSYSVGPLVSIVNCVVVPRAARWLVKNDPNKATALILVSRLMTSLLVPVCALYNKCRVLT